MKNKNIWYILQEDIIKLKGDIQEILKVIEK